MAIIPTSGEFAKVPEGGDSDNRFVVTLTPRADDYHGTMDKTPAEIDEAWNCGKSIWFTVADPGESGGMTVPVAARISLSPGEYQYVARILYVSMNVLIVAATSSNSSTYGTTIYKLTPAGS